MNPKLLQRGMNLWPPFLGAGIRVKHIAEDWREVRVELRLGLANRNFEGGHFGGSLFAMTDPFFMIMLRHLLGKDYFVSHAGGAIEYLAQARGTVHATFRIDDRVLEDIRGKTAKGEKYYPLLEVNVLNASSHVVARARHTLYVQRRRKVAGTVVTARPTLRAGTRGRNVGLRGPNRGGAVDS
jgi:acyl-coenzyme A thioesterase PaaI-like protein